MTKQEQLKLMVSELFNKYNKIVLDTKEVSEIIGKAEISLRRDRTHGRGIPFTKLHGAIRYTLTDIVDYILSSKVKVG